MFMLVPFVALVSIIIHPINRSTVSPVASKSSQIMKKSLNFGENSTVASSLSKSQNQIQIGDKINKLAIKTLPNIKKHSNNHSQKKNGQLKDQISLKSIKEDNEEEKIQLHKKSTKSATPENSEKDCMNIKEKVNNIESPLNDSAKYSPKSIESFRISTISIPILFLQCFSRPSPYA